MSQGNGGHGAGTVLMAFLAGAAVGGIVALLYAPQEGRKTRQKILDLGEFWESQTGAPIPLGGIVIRRTLADDERFQQ